MTSSFHCPLDRFFPVDFLDSDIIPTDTPSKTVLARTGWADKVKEFDINLEVIDILCDFVCPLSS